MNAPEKPNLYEQRYGKRGAPPEIEFLRRYARSYDDARQRLLATVYTTGEPALAVRHRELIAAAIIAVRGFPSVEHHLRRALQEGSSVAEVVEAMTVAALTGGFRTLVFALGYVAKLVEELGLDAGDPDGPGAQAGPGAELDAALGFSSPEFDWLARHSPAFEAARRDLVAHVFAPTSGAALSVKHRELIAAAVLASRGMPAVEQHLRRALREGATLAEVIEALQVAGVPGGLPTLEYALGHLMRIVDENGAGA